jgi:hypothetical protein
LIYEECTTQLTSAVVRFKIPLNATVRASILHGGHIEARGILRDGELVLHSNKVLAAGRYRLRLATGTGKHTHTRYSTITLS